MGTSVGEAPATGRRCWDDGSGRITVVRSKTDVEATGAVVAITPAAMWALDAIRPDGVGSSA